MFVILQLLVLYIPKCEMNLILAGTIFLEKVQFAKFTKLSPHKQ